MQIYVDLATKSLIRAVGDSRQITQLDFKRGDGASIEIIFVQDGTQTEITTGSIITFGAKVSGKYDANALVLESGFSLSGSGTTAKYVGSPSFNTEDLNDAFALDGNDANDVASLDLMGEITWTDGPTGEPTSTQTFTVRVNNDVLRGTEVGPVDITEGTPVNSSLAITGTLTDGTDPVTFPTLIYGGVYEGYPFWSESGTIGDANGHQCYYTDGQWTLEKNVSSASTARWTSADAVAHPRLVSTWTPETVGGPDATGTPVFSETVTDGRLGSMKVDEDFLYVVCKATGGVPFWKKITLESL